MPLSGVICPYDGAYRSFDECICSHETGGRTCNAPVQLLKVMRDNHLERKDAGWSASTLLMCAREHALQEKYDYYEGIESGWNKARGTWVHAMIEADQYPREGLIRERRIEKTVVVDGTPVRLTGKPDEIDTKLGLLIDYKSKDALPRVNDIGHIKHEAQFNFYVGLCQGGTFCDTGEEANIEITRGGMHFLTWKTKDPFIKIGYPVWSQEKLDEFIVERVRPLIRWEQTGELPKCNAFVRYPGRWRCSCVKLEEQLRERGIFVE